MLRSPTWARTWNAPRRSVCQSSSAMNCMGDLLHFSAVNTDARSDVQEKAAAGALVIAGADVRAGDEALPLLKRADQFRKRQRPITVTDFGRHDRKEVFLHDADIVLRQQAMDEVGVCLGADFR